MSNFIYHLICALFLFCSTASQDPRVIEIVDATETPATTVIFLHWTGGSGPELKRAVEELIGSFSVVPKLKFIFPTCKPIRFTPSPWNGSILNTWFDIDEFKMDAAENTTTVEESAEELKRIIDKEILSGVPSNRICVVGFARGGSMALHMGYEYTQNLGCVGVMSSWLPTTTNLYSRLLTTSKDVGRQLPPVYFSLGTLDPVAMPPWVNDTIRLFRSAGIPTTVNILPGAKHELTKSAIHHLFKFIEHNISN